MFGSYKKINVKVLSSFCVPYQQMSFLSDLDCILTGKISKAYWVFENEKDPTHNLIPF